MASAFQRPNTLAKQFEELSQLLSNFNKTIEHAIATATHEMNSLIGSIKENIEETATIVTNDRNEWKQMRANLSKT